MAKLAATKYSEAIFELAVQEGRVDEFYNEAEVILKECSENDEISKLLNHPKVSKEDKEHFIEDTFGRVISKEMTGLLVLMIAKDRHKDIVETLNMFMAKVLEYKKLSLIHI